MAAATKELRRRPDVEFAPAPRAPRTEPEPRSWPLRRGDPDRNSPAGRRRRLCRDLLRGTAIVIALHAFVVQISVVRGHSMRPCLHDGDRLVVDRFGGAPGEIERFDLVVLKNPRDPEVDYVKRIVGLPGDRLAMVDGHLTVSGRPVPEPFGPIYDHASFPAVVVPAGHFFVLGDNRPISCDSREFGLVPEELVRGRVRARFWPPSRITVF